MKFCGTCKEEKEVKFFGVRKASHDGLSPKCKACASAYDKARANNPDRVKAREEYQKTDAGKESVERAKKKWAANNRGKIYELTKSYRERCPKKYKAHSKVGYEVRVGNLTSKPCEVCSKIEGVCAHHDDYDKPLDIRWLCQYHHRQWHKENGEGKNAF